MQTPKTLIFLALLAIGAFTIGHAAADVIESSKAQTTMKMATITQMYEQDISNEGMDYPVVLQQFSNSELQAAMQLEQDYFDREQMSCHVGYDVLWNSQDPDYTQGKQFTMTEQGLVKVSLEHGGSVYYDLMCDGMGKDVKCQVADVILDDNGTSLKEHLLKTCR